MVGTLPRDQLPVEMAQGKAIPTNGETVLVVEDDAAVRSYATRCLESMGYQVVPAVDGREALQKLEGGLSPDILFTDVVMPGGMNGWEVAQRAREMCPGLGVLLTSGYALDSLTASGRMPAADMHILPKPYRKSELARSLRDSLLTARTGKEMLV